jgi:SAM-dependent methyltransferase
VDATIALVALSLTSSSETLIFPATRLDHGVTAPMYSASSPRITYTSLFTQSRNPFRDKFSSWSDEEWLNLWLNSETKTTFGDLELPMPPSPALQSQIHGSASWEQGTRESYSFYQFIKSNEWIPPEGRFLDFGCGWGRITRPFMRHFDLAHIYGFEPNPIHAIIARALNPYMTVFNGGFDPDDSLPKSWFDLVVGWSIFSHLSDTSLREWLKELSSVVRVGGHIILTTWGERFLLRLQREQELLRSGKDIHWYSKHCLAGVGDVDQRLQEYRSGKFIWFTATENINYGEAFLSEKIIRSVIEDEGLPLKLVKYDSASLSQDVFALQKVS